MRRNGKIDFLKFIFAMFIMILHLGYRPKFTLWGMNFEVGQKGGFGVTFFFIVSGYLLAASLYRQLESPRQISEKDTDGSFEFIVKKYKHYIGWYFMAFILCASLDCLKNGFANMVKNLIRSIPSLFLLGSLGYSNDTQSIGYYVGASWYISALFISQIILYPFFTNYKRYISVYAPIVFVVLFGMGILGHGNSISFAMCRIVLGQLCFEVVKYFDSLTLSRISIVAIRLIEMSIYIVCFAYMSISGFDDLEYGMMFLVTVAISISFSRHSEYLLFIKPIFSFLGRVSFPMYLLHIQILHWMNYIVKDTIKVDIRDSIYYPCLYVFIVLVSAVAYSISDRIRYSH